MKIGLTYTGDKEKHQNYIYWLKGNNDISIITLSAEENNGELVNECDGLVLSGGIDIYPAYYKSSKTDYPNRPSQFQQQRDEFEIAAFNTAQEKNIPVLGVCRGLQLINCIYGGTLKQDLGKAPNSTHKAEVVNQVQKDKAHGISIETNTLLHDLVNSNRQVVNSAHHQAVQRLGKGLKINCYSDDGLIEGFERADTNGKPFLLAIQWHPERMYQFNLQESPVTKAIRDHFIEEIKKSIK